MPLDFQQILDLEKIEEGLYRGRTAYTDVPRIFGGEVASQALVAAGRTVTEDRFVHSLHSYFLRPGDPRTPVLYRVDAIRDGRSFATRRVTATQNGDAVFTLAASFHRVEHGFMHQLPRMVAVDPAKLPSAMDVLVEADLQTREWFVRLSERFPVEVRFPEELPRLATMRGEPRPPRQRVWIRSSQALSEDPLVHACAMTYVSDLFLLAAALPPHGTVLDDPGVQMASLDHAVWFHAPVRADEWMFYDMEGSWAGGARALCHGRMFNQSGRLLAHVVQEGLVRSVQPSRFAN